MGFAGQQFYARLLGQIEVDGIIPEKLLLPEVKILERFKRADGGKDRLKKKKGQDKNPAPF